MSARLAGISGASDVLRGGVVSYASDVKFDVLGVPRGPVISESDESWTFNEGCLSIPDQYAEIERPDIVRARWLDRQGREQEGEFDGLMSVCLQHEVDHLNGILFIDHLARHDKKEAMRRIREGELEHRIDVALGGFVAALPWRRPLRNR